MADAAGGELPLCALQFSILNRLEVGVEVDNTSPLKILQHIWPFGASYFSRAKFSSLNLCLYLELLKIIKLTVLKKTRKKCQIFFLFLCYRPTFLSRVSIDTAILSVAVRYSIETTQHTVLSVSNPHHTVGQSFFFVSVKQLRKIPTWSSPAGTIKTGGI